MWDEDDEGLPDAAFTETELAAGVQHIMRTGDPSATSSNRRISANRDGDPFIADSYEIQPLRFETFAQARAWAQANPGGTFKRTGDGQAFEVKSIPVRNTSTNDSSVSTFFERTAEIREMVPHLENVLSQSAGNHRGVRMQPFDPQTWAAEFSQLSITQRERLRLVLSTHLSKSRADLTVLVSTISHTRGMKAGHYGEELSERLHSWKACLLTLIDG
jgi:hypothetical protein